MPLARRAFSLRRTAEEKVICWEMQTEKVVRVKYAVLVKEQQGEEEGCCGGLVKSRMEYYVYDSE